MSRSAHRALALFGIVAVAACNETTSPSDGEQTTIRFSAQAESAGNITAEVEAGSLVLTGSNGTLQIDEMHVIVDRFELKRVDDDSCAEEDHVCERFTAPPMLLDLPLDGSNVIAVQQPVDPGDYRRLKFEIEDLDDSDESDDDDGPNRAQQIRELRSAIRAQFPDWPEDASMLVTGTFTPTGGEPVAFRVYFEAEIEIEKRFVPPITISSDANGGTFTVELDLALLFRTGTGTVRDLGALDFDRTGRVLEFEVELENGFTEVEFDD